MLQAVVREYRLRSEYAYTVSHSSPLANRWTKCNLNGNNERIIFFWQRSFPNWQNDMGKEKVFYYATETMELSATLK